MPSSHVKAALSQLKNKFEEDLSSLSVTFKKLKTYGTCRRLIVLCDLAIKQEDKEEIIVGPPKAVAFAEDGTFTQAAKGFAKAKGVSVKQLQVLKTKKGEYVGLKKVKKGKLTKDTLSSLVPQIISSLTFPKMMRWEESNYKFSRPINNVLCIFGGELISFTVAGKSSSDSTTGHRVYFPQKLKINSFQKYREVLDRKKVIVDQEKRRRVILNQIERKLIPLNAQLLPDEELLEELVYNIEHPYVFLGSFPENYLSLPLEVLSTAMKEGQKLFSVVRGSKQLPYFLGVADAFRDSKSLIRKGNERVLKARLEDARFFWKEDQKIPTGKRLESLGEVVFQEKLGSYKDKSQNLKKIVSYLADKVDAGKTKKELMQAAELCKTDLVTEMVREFPSLQGKVGGLYLKAEGYPVSVWKAVYEHYQPTGSDDASPSTLSGALLSIADKLDSIVGLAGVGIRVTGSKDPFALRRHAHGICKIILDKKLCFSFTRLVDKMLNVYGEKLECSKEEVKSYCSEFFLSRLQHIYESRGYRYDLVKAALQAGIDNIYYSFLRLKALDALKTSSHFEPLILITKRVNNIIQSQPPYKLKPDLLQEKEERELYTTFAIIKDNVLPIIARGDFTRAQKIILSIRSSINKFFDDILVMAEEGKIRRNRLALLQEISKLFVHIADYSQIVVEEHNKD